MVVGRHLVVRLVTPDLSLVDIKRGFASQVVKVDVLGVFRPAAAEIALPARDQCSGPFEPKKERLEEAWLFLLDLR